MNDVERFWTKVDKSGECWEWTAGLIKGLRGGYGTFWFNGTDRKAHRYSYIIHHPLTIDLWEHREILVCHRCDNPKCVNPSHLFLGSVADNNKDCDVKGRRNQFKGEQLPQSKLTDDDVREIRIKYANGGITYKQLALEYDVSMVLIGKIVRRLNWTHI